jgi:hypothetical protein
MGICLKSFKKIDNNLWLFLGGAILILWQMLKPGYILTLDMVFTPKLKLDYFFSEGSVINPLPLVYFLKFLDLFLAGWVIEKIIIFCLFFLIGYLAFKFLPLPKKFYINYWGALFYTVNPFVYERFLAGHWLVLFGYAFLPSFIHYLIKFFKEPTLKAGFWLFGWLFLINIFSLHVFVMVTLILVSYLIVVLAKNLILKNNQKTKLLLKNFAMPLAIFLIISGYWLAPYILNKNNSVINTFNDPYQWEAFKTSSDAQLRSSLNVLALYGFWGEHEPWAGYFLWPKDNFLFWLPVFLSLALLIVLGAIFGLLNKENRPKTLFFLILGVISYILSCGLGETMFKGFNLWLFKHLNFWSGFRDTNKFSGLLVLSYVYLGATGIMAVMDFVKSKNFKFSKQLLMFFFIIPLLYTYTMLGGFARQLIPVWYPADWQKVNAILNQDNNDFKVLFLPWHLYFSLDFNHQLVTANPAKGFFDKPVIQGENMELGKIYSQDRTLENQEIEGLIINNNLSADYIITALENRGIKYIIFAHDLDELKEKERFNFLRQGGGHLKEIFDSNSLTLYKIVL